MDSSRYPTRRTERLRTLTVWIAVGAILLSLWALWDFWDRRHTIDEACGGLVPAGAVLDLSPSGGSIAGGRHDEDTIDLAEDFPQRCDLYSSESAESAEADAERLRFFTAQVSVERAGAARPATWRIDASDPFARYTGDGYADQPTGGGINGTVTDSGALVRLPCTGGSGRGEDVETIVATAVQQNTRREFAAEDGQMTQADRDTIVRIAVETANNLAGRLGCAERLPDPPDHVPGVQTSPVAAERADGTCAWYVRADFPPAAREWLPDQAHESRTDDEVWNERCLLRVSPEAARKPLSRHRDDPALKDFYRSQDGDDVWWARTESFFGEPARHVELDDAGRPAVHPEPGTAGHTRAHIWWASSVCDSEPAVHTLTLGWPYSMAAQRHYGAVFRAYVDAVAERRGCTDVRLPPPDTFTSP